MNLFADVFIRYGMDGLLFIYILFIIEKNLHDKNI